MKPRWKSWVELVLGTIGVVTSALLLTMTLLDPWETQTLLWAAIGILGVVGWSPLVKSAWEEV